MLDVAARVWRVLLDPCYETSTVSVRSAFPGRLFPCAQTCKTTQYEIEQDAVNEGCVVTLFPGG
jgi:hypothetical protein